MPKDKSNNKERLAYLILLISLNTAYLLIKLLTVFHFLYSKKTIGDIILYPYSQPGSDGYTRRFEEYFKFLEKDNQRFCVCNLFSDEYYIKCMDGTRADQYKMYQKTIWKRIPQVLKARKYKSAFIHRGLFPFYPDQTKPHLEILLEKLNQDITIDFWDSVWIANERLVNETIKHCHRISAVNNFIKDYFKEANKDIVLFPIGVNLENYQIKTDYNIDNILKLFYTGGPGNVFNFLNLIKPVLYNLKNKIKFKLLIVSRARIYLEGIDIEYHNFEDNTFFELLRSADIGIYRIEDNDIAKGKMAMKVLDYWSTALPAIVSPVGLSPYAINEENVLFAISDDDWEHRIIEVYNNHELRKKIGKNGRNTSVQYHSIESSYLNFVSMFSRN